MTEAIAKRVLDSIDTAAVLYHRLVILVGRSGSGKTRVMRAVADDLQAPLVNVNLAISGELLELTGKQRSIRLPEVLDRITVSDKGVVLLDNIEVLFDRDLKQDPLRLLQGISRNQVVVVSWNGVFAGEKLIYAESGHPEYRCYDSVDAQIINMDLTVGESAEHKGEA